MDETTPSAFENVGDLLVETSRVLKRGTLAAVAASVALALVAALIVASGLFMKSLLFDLRSPLRDVAGTFGVFVVIGACALGLALVLGAPIAAYGLAARGEAPRVLTAIRLSLRAAPRFACILFVTILFVGFLFLVAFVFSRGLFPEGTDAIAFFVLLPIALVWVARVVVGYVVPASVVLVVEGASLAASFERTAALRRGRLLPLVVVVLLPMVLVAASVRPSAPGLALLKDLGGELDGYAFRFVTCTAAVASTLLATALAASAYGLASRAGRPSPNEPPA